MWSGSIGRWRLRAVDPAGIAAMVGLVLLIVACHGAVLFDGMQYAFRDSAHFYYPLHWRVQQEWSAGRLPLWEPGSSGGAPILGSPMAAVLYPGKLVFALLPYAWGVRIYTVGHELLAFGGMWWLLRSWGASRTGSAIAGLSYAFGGPVFSDYFNIIYLVSASWMPIGLLAADRWLRLRRPMAPIGLALILAMQVLGGDPEAAYLTMLAAFGYAAGLAGFFSRPGRWLAGIAAIAIAWTWIGPGLARWIHGGRWGQPAIALAWAVGLVGFGIARPRAWAVRATVGLAVAGALAILISAVQVLPVVENISESVRLDGSGPDLLYDSSLLPYRAAECLWPKVFGTFTHGHQYWMPILPPTGSHRPSPLTIYFGASAMLLALGASGCRGGPPWRGWMTVLWFVGIWAALGRFAGPSSWTEELTVTSGDDSFYGLLTTFLPGLRLFRFPFKLLIVASIGASALAGLGWDRLGSGQGRRRTLGIGIVLLAATLALLATAATTQIQIAAAIAARDPGSAIFGPIDARGAAASIVAALAHGAIAMASALALFAWRMRRPESSAPGVVAVLVLALDLAAAQAPLVVAIPQADFERKSEVARAIHDEESRRPEVGPFRVHRLPSWLPIGWAESSSTDRLREVVDWEIETMQPSFGWMHGLSYAYVDESETGRADFRQLFRPVPGPPDPSLAAALGVEPGRPILLHPRGAYDLWGARYFIIPSYPGDWREANRSYAAFVDETDLIYPDPQALAGPERAEARRDWLFRHDVQVRRNRRAFPRAWVVHEARPIRPLGGPDDPRRAALVHRIVESADELRQTTYLETDDPPSIAAVLRPSTGGESVEVREEAPTRTTIQVELATTGIVVLADVLAPGWKLEIDGKPAPILRANLAMRAAVVAAGQHTLTYRYEPASLPIGVGLSILGVLLASGVAVQIRRRVSSSETIQGAKPQPGQGVGQAGRGSIRPKAFQ